MSDIAEKRKREERKIYVKRVSSLFVHNEPSNDRLFDACLLVGLTTTDPKNGEPKRNLPYVKSAFPPHVKPPDSIEAFCFPDADLWHPESGVQNPEHQCYSIVLTDERGKRVFGYCRRVLPEGGMFCLPLAYCIISPHRANGFFHKVLKELESRHGSSELENFMRQLYACEFPNPGQSIKLNKILEKAASGGQDGLSTLLQRPQDVRLEEKDLTLLIRVFSIPVFLKLFSSILLERRVILIAKSLSTLSLCMESLQSILFPFTWQHTYIPVLPSHLVEFCQAPTPYIFGLLKSAYHPHDFINFSEGILLDVDERKVLKCCRDESSILPGKFETSLRNALSLAEKYNDSSGISSVIISESFIRFFVETCGHYLLFLNGGTFDKDGFVKYPESRSIRYFLEWFTETAMFYMFIQERLRCDVQDVFHRRVMDFSEEREKNLALLNKNYNKIVNKSHKTFDRIRDKFIK